MTLIPLVPARTQPPDGWEDRPPYRQYNVYVNPWLTNLIANPTERETTWAGVDAATLFADFTQLEYDRWDANVILAAQVTPDPVRLYPGMRLLSNTQTNYPDYIMNLSYWQARAAELIILAGKRLPSDPRICLDIESYGSSQHGGDDTDLKLKISTDGAIDTGVTLAADTLVKVTIGRNGNKAWRYVIDGGSAVDVTSVGTAGDVVASCFGGGQDPAFAPANSRQDSMSGFVAVAQGHWDRFLSAAEMVALNGSSHGVPVGYGG